MSSLILPRYFTSEGKLSLGLVICPLDILFVDKVSLSSGKGCLELVLRPLLALPLALVTVTRQKTWCEKNNWRSQGVN